MVCTDHRVKRPVDQVPVGCVGLSWTWHALPEEALQLSAHARNGRLRSQPHPLNTRDGVLAANLKKNGEWREKGKKRSFVMFFVLVGCDNLLAVSAIAFFFGGREVFFVVG